MTAHKERIKELAWAFTAAGALTNGVSIWVTYEGLLTISGNPTFAALLATVAGVIGFLVTFVASQVMPWVPPQKVWAALLGLLVGFAAIGAGSTSVAMIGLASPEAQRIEMRQTLDRAQRALEAQQIRARDQAKAQGWVEALATRLEGSAAEERRLGLQVSKGKRSRSARDLEVLAQAYRASALQLQADNQRRQKAAALASRRLTQLRALVDKAQANTQDLRRIQQPYLQKLREFNLALAELQRSALGDEPLSGALQVLATQSELGMKIKSRSRAKGAAPLSPPGNSVNALKPARSESKSGKPL